MKIGLFGWGQPAGIFTALGISGEDLTGDPGPENSPATPFVEPFMDPFAASLLHRLAAGHLSEFSAIVFLRESPGAAIAFHYAQELVRRDLAPGPVPHLVLLNLVMSQSAPAQAFNVKELARLETELSRVGWGAKVAPPQDPEPPHPSQADGLRFALLGAPLGNRLLQDRLSQTGVLVFDQQAAECAWNAPGECLDRALGLWADNPFAARQPRALYIPAIRQMVADQRPDVVLWQVEPHDDLWGWLAPGVADLVQAAGARFVDLGFLSRWPDGAEVNAAMSKGGLVDGV